MSREIKAFGIIYDSVSKMCRAHNVSTKIFYQRLKQGMTVEQALKGGKKKNNIAVKTNGKEVTDPWGKRFSNKTAMCDYHGVSLTLYINRVKRGKNQKEALSSKKGHYLGLSNGKDYKNINELCKDNKISTKYFKDAIKNGCSYDDAIIAAQENMEKYKKKNECYDHNGKAFTNQNEMARYYGVNIHTLRARLRKGYPLESCLTAPAKKGRYGIYESGKNIFQT